MILMVVTGNLTNKLNIPLSHLDGVVSIRYGNYRASGALLYDGKTILTTAHLFQDFASVNPLNIEVYFKLFSSTIKVKVTQLIVHPNYDSRFTNYDLALLVLEKTAPVEASRYQLYRKSDEVGKEFLMAGYGLTGYGKVDETKTNEDQLSLSFAKNTFDAIVTEERIFREVLGLNIVPGSQILADFDNGTIQRDALGGLLNKTHLGLGDEEGLIARGDSGGPAFVENKIAGVASYITSISLNGLNYDVDEKLNSSFGEIGAWQRISYYQEWIDMNIRNNLPDAPKSPKEVVKSIYEGNSGTKYVYFLVQFHGERDFPNQILSVDYQTKDGTAKAWEDYIPVSGTLNLYPGENQAVIPVEVIGDTIPEEDEVFYLEIFNPVGGSFPFGVERLSASRTILNDDYLLT